MQELNHCGCCEGLSAETPVPIYNRPGLEAIAYRVGNHAAFRESLLARLSTSRSKPLSALTTRSNDDFTIALLDAWATVADVLTFYGERIANESYLGTATELLSVVELARLIGYELKPGVAAAAWLAFTIDENAGLTGLLPGPVNKPQPVSIPLETGIRVQSIPAPDEAPQTFETVEQITARAEWNSIKPRMTQAQTAIPENAIVVIAGTANDLKEGDIFLIVRSGGTKVLKKLLKAVVDEDAKTTKLYFDAEAQLPAFTTPAAYVPDGDITDYEEKKPLTNSIVAAIGGKVWKSTDLETLVQTQGWPENELTESVLKNVSAQAASADAVYVFRKRAFVFGYNAMMRPTYSKRVPDPPDQWKEWDLKDESNSKIYLDTVYDGALPGSFVAVQKETDDLSAAIVYPIDKAEHRPRTAYGISAKSTVLTIPSSAAWWGSGTQLSAFRDITVYVQSHLLPLAPAPVTENISGASIMLDRIYLGLAVGRKVIVSGERVEPAGASASELKTIDAVFVDHGFTVLRFDRPFDHTYLRATVRINANIAAATHGETVKETVGSGDASKTFQQFTLRQPPLTFVGAPTATGAKSTLQIRVNELLWHEVPSLYGREKGERIFITRQDDAGKTTVIFGNGKNGARLPGGAENIKATYRKGTGTAGLLKPAQLSQLITRPAGVKSVTNPLKTSDAGDGEKRADARRNATLAIFTLGRIVSLQDYEDFARSYAGISKALALWTWTGQRRSIYLTIAGAEGREIDPAGKLYPALLKAIAGAGIPEVPVTVASYKAKFFRITANILTHPDYIPENVLAAVKQQLSHRFSFETRSFGQPVVFSEVVAAMQSVAGVIAVDVSVFCRSDESSGIGDRIEASVPRPGHGLPSPAEMLLIDPASISLQASL